MVITKVIVLLDGRILISPAETGELQTRISEALTVQTAIMGDARARGGDAPSKQLSMEGI